MRNILEMDKWSCLMLNGETSYLYCVTKEPVYTIFIAKYLSDNMENGPSESFLIFIFFTFIFLSVKPKILTRLVFPI